MGKNRDRADALFDAFERELTEVAKAGGRDVSLRKKWRLQTIEAAKRRGLTIKQFIDEIRPVYIESIQRVNELDPDVLHPRGKSVPFALWGSDIKTKH